MHWQLQVDAQPIRHLAILPGTPSQLAVTDSRYKIRFYDLDNGAYYSDLSLDPDLLDNDVLQERQAGLEALKAPNGAFLPFVQFNASNLYVSQDGKLRLIHDLNAGLTLEIEGVSEPLETGDEGIRWANWERDLGTIAALSKSNKLYLFQQHLLMNEVDLEKNDILNLFVVGEGSRVLLVEADGFQLLNTTGKLVRSQDIFYTIGTSALSPDGNLLLIGDADHQLLRLYNRDLVPVRQRHAVDLLSRSRQLQLFAEEPAPSTPFKTLTIANDGTLAFAMGGVLCTTHIKLMNELPQPRLLL